MKLFGVLLISRIIHMHCFAFAVKRVAVRVAFVAVFKHYAEALPHFIKDFTVCFGAIFVDHTNRDAPLPNNHASDG